MGSLVLVPIGELEPEWLPPLVEPLARRTGLTVRVEDQRIPVEPAYVAARAQYDSRVLLSMLDSLDLNAWTLRIGVTYRDLFSSVFTFVFGEAHLRGRSAVVSIYRLHPERYGLPSDPAQVRRRLLAETVHECGHLLGAVHCRAPGCVMNFSGVVEEIDLKTADFCADCRRVIRERRGGP